ncbi:MAG: hypothetical protein R3F17_07250 [Planctomycetota bacterium]
MARWIGLPGPYRISGLAAGDCTVRLLEGDGPGLERRVHLEGDSAQVEVFGPGAVERTT